jgi:predicted ABC-type transport system involved in lysophospholipase L1 biosynthesis ATPase subunit
MVVFLDQRINNKFCVKLSVEMKRDVFNIIPKAMTKFSMEKRHTHYPRKLAGRNYK